MFHLLVFGLLKAALAQNTTEEGDDGATPIWSLTSKIASGSSNICGATFADTNAVSNCVPFGSLDRPLNIL